MTAPAILAPWSADRVLRYDELLDLLDRHVSTDSRVLEFGAGAGGLRAVAPMLSVVTVDLNAPDVDVRADGAQLPFRAGAFAAATCIDVLEHVDSGVRGKVVRELARVTTGTLIFGGPTGSSARLADERIADRLRRRSHPVPPWLDEHLRNRDDYPDIERLAPEVNGSLLAAGDGISISAHRLLVLASGIRGGTRLLAAILRRRRLRAAVGWASRRGSAYRRTGVYDLAPVSFSVIVPTRNRADRLPVAIAGILAQSVDDLEIIVVDDASTDDTAEVLSELRGRDRRIRFITLPSPTGSAGLARNEGLIRARGTFVAFCDDDVRWRPNHLEVVARGLMHAEVVYTVAQRSLPDGRVVDDVGRSCEGRRPQVGDIDTNTLAALRAVVGVFPDSRGRYQSEDILLLQRLHADGHTIRHVPETTVDYCFNLTSHCFHYVVSEVDGHPFVSSRPIVNDRRAAVNRVKEAMSARAGRISRRFSHAEDGIGSGGAHRR